MNLKGEEKMKKEWKNPEFKNLALENTVMEFLGRLKDADLIKVV